MPIQWDPDELPLCAVRKLSLDFGAYRGGFQIRVPFRVSVGRTRTPRVLLIAGIHGDEYEGVAALHDFARSFDSHEHNGTLTIVPVANPEAFHAGTRNHPVDGGDLNRAFPGDPGASITRRLAHVLFQELVLGNDALLSLHGWTKEANVIAYAEYPADSSETAERSRHAAWATGMTYFHPYDWLAGVLGQAAIPHGIAAVDTEVGGQGTITREGQRENRNLMTGFLRYWGVLESARPTSAETDSRIIVAHADVFASCAGLFRSSLRAGDNVEPGAHVGTIFGLDGEPLQRLSAPVAGIVAILRTFCSVHVGDRLVQIFIPQVNPWKSK